ncbi:hypothetical protein QR680_005641 [Steinernema hermaphroditum]|uniref:C2H2-type domain-containing protein n=1 Tax=Steinernema hermaphroditum TaxID=289476 RepID=A0AA39LW25_9BILA|nr:hypothetical protein QR680_005641 [Steinernema hermaphroditum]
MTDVPPSESGAYSLLRIYKSWMDESWFLRFLIILCAYSTVGLPAYFVIRYVKKRNQSLETDESRRSFFYSFLVRFSIGLDRKSYLPVATDEKSSLSSQQSVPVVTGRRNLLEDCAALLFCFFGIQSSLIVMGFLQERLMTQGYKKIPSESVPSGIIEKFGDTQFLMLMNRLFSMLIYGSYIFYNRRRQPPHVAPYYVHSYTSLSNTMSSWCQYEALKYVTFPTQTVCKASKIIPTMIMGRIVRNERYSVAECMNALVLAFGASLFFLSSTHSRKSTAELSGDYTMTVSGLILMAGYLAFDAFTPNWQKSLFDTKPKISKYQKAHSNPGTQAHWRFRFCFIVQSLGNDNSLMMEFSGAGFDGIAEDAESSAIYYAPNSQHTMCDPWTWDSLDISVLEDEDTSHSQHAPDPVDVVYEFPFDIATATESEAESSSSRSKTDKPYQCTEAGCGLSFKSRSSLNRHWRTKHEHGGLAKFTCPDCEGVSFNYHSDLLVHQRTAHEGAPPAKRSIPCLQCPAMFRTTADLDTHIARVHEKLKMHECPQCHEMFDREFTLQMHIKRRHSIRRDFQCPYCRKMFANLYDLVHFHAPVCSTPRDFQPYKCALCPQTYRHATSLSRHKRFAHGNATIADVRQSQLKLVVCDREQRTHVHQNHAMTKTIEDRTLGSIRGLFTERPPEALCTPTMDISGDLNLMFTQHEVDPDAPSSSRTYPTMSQHNMIYHIAMLLDKMNSPDKDYRFMATNDMIVELQRDSLKLDDDTEKKIVQMILRLLDDKNGEVQNLAVKSLAPLSQKVHVHQFEHILDVLCAKLMNTNQNMQSRERDVTSIALKTVMSGIPINGSPVASAAVRKVMPTIIQALSDDQKAAHIDPSVKLELLDIVGDLVSRFGNSLSADMTFPELQRVLFTQICSDRLTLRKRAITALSSLAAVCEPDLAQKVISNLVELMNKETKKVSLIRTYVLLAASFASSASSRFAEYLSQVVPIVLKICDTHEDEELKEACVSAFETFVYAFPKEIEGFLPKIVAFVKEAIRFDPNFNDDADDEDEQMETDGDSEGSDLDDYSDDEDMSWKVRRASAKCIQALLVTRRSELVQSIRDLGSVLILRMKEREENVRIDVFQSYVSLLKEVRTSVPNVWRRGAVSGDNVTMVGNVAYPEGTLTEDHIEVLSALNSQIPALMKALSRQMKSRSLKTRQQCFVLLANLVKAYPACLSEYFNSVIPATEVSLNDKAMEGNLKISLLEFVETMVTLHDVEAFALYAQTVVPLITKVVDESFYKVTSAGLQVLHVMLIALRPDASTPSILSDSSTLLQLLSEIYKSVGLKLKANDIDQEVKEQAIECAGTLVALFGDNPAVNVDDYLAVLVDRLKNEMTRLAAVKALTATVNSPLKINMMGILSDTLGLTAEFLRKNIRTLKLATLQLLCALIARYSKGGLEGEALIRVTSEVPVLVNETDLQISQLALRFISDVIPAYPDQISKTLAPLFESFILLTKSPLLQGKTLKSALKLLEVLVKSPLANKPSYEEMLDQLSKSVYEQPCTLPRQAFMSISKCCAVVCRYSGELQKTVQLTAKFAQQLNIDGPENENVRLFSLLCLGEIGRIYTNVYDESVAAVTPMEFIANVYDTHSDEVKSHASLALGAVAAGNLTRFLPFLLHNIISQPKRQYLLLHALSEVIASENINEHYVELFRPHINDVWKVLMDYRGHQKEGSRNVIAKCLGKLAMIDPGYLLGELEECLSSQDSHIKSTAVTAIRFTLVDRDQPIDTHLKPVIMKFLRLINDADVQVRRLALVAFNAAVHNKMKMIRPMLGELLPMLYHETTVKKELIREVEMGPFKHAVDDGLDIRKAAFECLYTLLENGLDQVDVIEFIGRLEDGIQDNHDIKLISYLMVQRLCQLCPHQVAQRGDKLATLIKTQFAVKCKQNAVKQENDKYEEARRLGMRTLIALNKLNNEFERIQTVVDVVSYVRANPDLGKLYDSVQREEKMRPTCTDMSYMMETD